MFSFFFTFSTINISLQVEMSFLFDNYQFTNIHFLQLSVHHSLWRNDNDWLVENTNPSNLYLDVYLYIIYKGDTRMIGMVTSIIVIDEDVLHVQCEVVEPNSFYLLQLDIQVNNFRPDLMKSLPYVIQSHL